MPFTRRLVFIWLAASLAGCSGSPSGPDGDRADGPENDAQQLLARSVAYHDPDNAWRTKRLTLTLDSARPDGSTRLFRIEIETAREIFALSTEREGKRLEYACDGETCTATVDGNPEVSDEDRELFILDREDGAFWRNYFVFLLGLPMNLRDAGLYLDPEPRREEFNGRQTDAVKVTFDPNVGADTWYFYFDPDTAALLGYRFYHDEAKNDGEYITLDGETEAAGLRLPKVRRWYVNADDRFLGSDTVSLQ